MKSLLSNPCFYYYARQLMVGGLPFREWVSLYQLNRREERIADIGCGPADMLRYVKRDSKPGYYLGIDISEKYIEQAKAKACRLNIPSDFVPMDLEKLPYSANVQSELRTLIDEKDISTVLLLGVLHHIDDDAVTMVLDLIFDMPKVSLVITQDILTIPGSFINNFFAAKDRGKFVRTEKYYDQLLGSGRWKHIEKYWTKPGISSIKYIHYKLSRVS
jgi:SAM-dependent methyltransferase